jgi:hypothetical protein
MILQIDQESKIKNQKSKTIKSNKILMSKSIIDSKEENTLIPGRSTYFNNRSNIASDSIYRLAD